MSDSKISCDQAIFTSTRTPMGEGYRIIAASAGLRPEDKQVITRNSPSHDSLCSQANDARAFAWYPLPSERLCASLSCLAGAEHTGRGGQRIYTHNLIFDEAHFAVMGFNPFNVFRAMERAGMFQPQLTPTQILPEHSFDAEEMTSGMVAPEFPQAVGPAARCHILQRLLDDGGLVVHLDKHWPECAEAIILGLPGPMRAKVGFSAGLRYSIGRSHRLHVLCDDKGTARTRVTGQKMEFIEPGSVQPSNADRSAWVTFVERHWCERDFAGLVRRTSRAFSDLSPPGRERIGRLYNFTDELSKTETAKLISRASDYLQNEPAGMEGALCGEFLERARIELVDRFRKGVWLQVKQVWPGVVGLWRRSKKCSEFAGPVVSEALRAASREHPLTAAEAALETATSVPAFVDVQAHGAIIESVLQQVLSWCPSAIGVDVERLNRVVSRWHSLRPACAVVRRIRELMAQPATT